MGGRAAAVREDATERDEMNVKLPTFECLRCGHRWHPREPELSKCCGFCKSPYWNVAPEEESRAKGRHERECVSCKETS